MLLLPWWKQSNLICYQQVILLMTLVNGAILGTHWWFLLLASWVLSSGNNQVSLGEWKAMLLSPCSSPATMATLFMNPLFNSSSDWRKSAWYHRMSHFVHFIIKILCYPLLGIHMGHRYPHCRWPVRKYVRLCGPHRVSVMYAFSPIACTPLFYFSIFTVFYKNKNHSWIMCCSLLTCPT